MSNTSVLDPLYDRIGAAWKAGLLAILAAATPIAGPRAADPAGPRFAQPGLDQPGLDRATVGQSVYAHLMDSILGQAVENATGAGQQYRGGSNPYRQIQAKKALAACIFWREGSVTDPRHGGWSAQWAPEDESLSAILDQTVRDCRHYEEKGCRCQIIDIGGQNTVEVPRGLAVGPR